jgi:hypothetical protein
MDTIDDDPHILYPFELFDPIRKRWHRARWKATKADIETRGGRITGPGYLPTGGGQFMPPTGAER